MFHEASFWLCGRLAQQFVLDNWSRHEQFQMRHWCSSSFQEKIRHYVVNSRGKPPLPGKVFLPASVPGSPMQLQKFYHDALHISAVEGNPHLFITLTANAHWPEVKRLCRPNENPLTRLDVIARVFVSKRKRLFKLLSQHDYLFPGHRGMEWYIWVLEHQQSGLPHIHAAIRLRVAPHVSMKTQAEQLAIMDSFVSAQMPDVHRDPLAFHLVNSYMIHKKCSLATCMVKRKDGTVGCRFYFDKKKPVPFSHVDTRGFVVYKRGKDDLSVVPHCVSLLKDLRAHVNVEWTLSSQCIAYEYKYFTKGKTVSGVRISDALNEIAAWKAANVICAAEAVYRILGFHMHFRFPSVIICRINLPRAGPTENEAVQAFYEANAPSQISDSEDDNDILDAIEKSDHLFAGTDNIECVEEGINIFPDDVFSEPANGGEEVDDEVPSDIDAESESEAVRPNQINQYFGRPYDQENLTYTDFFANFKLAVRGATRGEFFFGLMGEKWVKRPTSKRVLARMPWISAHLGELYYLRVLLLAFPARSFDDLRGSFKTFAARAFHEGLVSSDVESVLAMRDAIRAKHSGATCRFLFCTLMFHVGNMNMAWENNEIRTYIVNDFEASEARGESWSSDIAQLAFLMEIWIICSDMGHAAFSLQNFGIPEAPTSVEKIVAVIEAFSPAHHAYRTLIRYAAMHGVETQTRTKNVDFKNEVRSHFERMPRPAEMDNQIDALKRPSTDEQGHRR